MPTVLIVKRTGEIEELAVKSYCEDELFKRAGFKTSDGFVSQTQWDIRIDDKQFLIHLYAKRKGRAGNENKYDFPPPVDTAIYYGNCVLVNTYTNSGEGTSCGDLTKDEWDDIYEALFGGFEDIGTEDSDETGEEETGDEKELPRTSTGYVKDDFVVEDDESGGENLEMEISKMIDYTPVTDTSELDATSNKKKSKSKSKSKKESKAKEPKAKKEKESKESNKKSKSKSKKTVFDNIESNTNADATNDVLTCTIELEEEEYL